MASYDDWFTPGMKEAPFYYDGITLVQYEAERAYLAEHFADLQNGTYEPLYNQKNAMENLVITKTVIDECRLALREIEKYTKEDGSERIYEWLQKNAFYAKSILEHYGLSLTDFDDYGTFA